MIQCIQYKPIIYQYQIYLHLVGSWRYIFFYQIGTHENPELIWNDEAREKVSELVKKMCKQ